MTRPVALVSRDGRVLCGGPAGPDFHYPAAVAGGGAAMLTTPLHDHGALDGPQDGWRWARGARPGTVDLTPAQSFAGPLGAGPYQACAAIDADVAADVFGMMRSAWLSESSGAVIPPADVRLGLGPVLRVGPFQADLTLPFALQALCRREDGGMFAAAMATGPEGWQVERLLLWRPLIYLCAFGREEIFEQLAHALRSLHEFGEYAGDVHILSDRPRDALAAYVPAALAARTTCSAPASMDGPAYQLARYQIEAWPPARLCQPLLYVDTDVVFDAPVFPMLRAVACADRLCAVREDFSDPSTDVGVGAHLFSFAGRAPPPGARGFNAGQIGVPNLARCAPVLAVVRGAACNAHRARSNWPYNDQPFANYVCDVLRAVDTDTLTPFADVGWGGRHEDARRRTGMVHFWPFLTPHDKRNAMAMYIEAVRKQRASEAPEGAA